MVTTTKVLWTSIQYRNRWEIKNKSKQELNKLLIRRHKMRAFVDTANLKDIKAAFDLGIITGVTTNPVLILRENTQDIKNHIMKIRTMCDGEILTQVVGSTSEEMIRQAKEISSWDDNITVKLPLNIEGIKAISVLRIDGVRTCATIAFNAAQAMAAAMAGATYVALFYNRSNAIGSDGIHMVKTVTEMYRVNNIKTQVIAASITSPIDVVTTALAGVDVITAPLSTWTSIIESRITDDTLESFLVNWTGKEI
jgi:transaldolase